MRARRLLAAIAVVLAAGALSACAEPEPEAPAVGGGPNGYELLETVGGVDVWFDRGEETSMTDIILTVDDNIVGSCLGKASTLCLQGDVAVRPFVIAIVPATSTLVQAGWQGTVYDLELMSGTPEEGDLVYFLEVPPPSDIATMTPLNFVAYDEAGAVVGSA